MRFSAAAGLMAGIALIGFAGAARADDEEEALEPFRACAAIAVAADRLACFDAALANADTLLAQRRERRHRRTVEDFGLSATQIEAREDRQRERAGADNDGPGNYAPEPVQITSPIAEVFTDAARSRIFLLENGQIWRQAGNTTLRGLIRPGGIATISEGSFGGGYRLRIEGRTGFVGVVRVR